MRGSTHILASKERARDRDQQLVKRMNSTHKLWQRQSKRELSRHKKLTNKR